MALGNLIGTPHGCARFGVFRFLVGKIGNDTEVDDLVQRVFEHWAVQVRERVAQARGQG